MERSTVDLTEPPPVDCELEPEPCGSPLKAVPPDSEDPPMSSDQEDRQDIFDLPGKRVRMKPKRFDDSDDDEMAHGGGRRRADSDDDFIVSDEEEEDDGENDLSDSEAGDDSGSDYGERRGMRRSARQSRVVQRQPKKKEPTPPPRPENAMTRKLRSNGPTPEEIEAQLMREEEEARWKAEKAEKARKKSRVKASAEPEGDMEEAAEEDEGEEDIDDSYSSDLESAEPEEEEPKREVPPEQVRSVKYQACGHIEHQEEVC